MRLLLTLLLVFLPCWATSIQIVPTATDFGSYYLYQYSVQVGEQSAGETGYQFTLFNLDGLVPNNLLIGSPPQWTFNTDFSNNSIQWVSLTVGADIGTSAVSGFSFRSVFGPGQVPFQLDLEYPSTDIYNPSITGFTAGPTMVPEPASWTGLMVGLVFFAFYKRR